MVGDPLELGTRRRLYEAIRRTPGIGAREVQRAAGTAWGETVYHLDLLTESGLLQRERTGHRDHYFVAQVPVADRGLLSLLRSPSARRLLLALLELPRSTVPELEARTGLSTGRLSVHLRRLMEIGVVRTGQSGRLRTFEVRERDRTVGLLTTYRASLADEWVERFLATWSELFRP